jgi:hypothetical protein
MQSAIAIFEAVCQQGMDTHLVLASIHELRHIEMSRCRDKADVVHALFKSAIPEAEYASAAALLEAHQRAKQSKLSYCAGGCTSVAEQQKNTQDVAAQQSPPHIILPAAGNMAAVQPSSPAVAQSSPDGTLAAGPTQPNTHRLELAESERRGIDLRRGCDGDAAERCSESSDTSISQDSQALGADCGAHEEVNGHTCRTERSLAASMKQEPALEPLTRADRYDRGRTPASRPPRPLPLAPRQKRRRRLLSPVVQVEQPKEVGAPARQSTGHPPKMRQAAHGMKAIASSQAAKAAFGTASAAAAQGVGTLGKPCAVVAVATGAAT